MGSRFAWSDRAVSPDRRGRYKRSNVVLSRARKVTLAIGFRANDTLAMLIPAPVDASSIPTLSGVFAPVTEEREATELSVRGGNTGRPSWRLPSQRTESALPTTWQL